MNLNMDNNTALVLVVAIIAICITIASAVEHIATVKRSRYGYLARKEETALGRDLMSEDEKARGLDAIIKPEESIRPILPGIDSRNQE